MRPDIPTSTSEPMTIGQRVYMDNLAYLRRLECSSPVRPGMYLQLLHGRRHPDQQMDDWGPDGPCFGPLDWVHITYNTTIGICGEGDNEGTGPMLGINDPMYFVEDMIFYEGMYYGDWEVVNHK